MAVMDAEPLDPPADLPTAPHPVWSRWLWLVGGWAALGLGTVGVFLPVIPTTPFVLVAAWCFSRGSQRMHRWLLEHRWFGSTVRSWEEHGVIPLRAKLLSTGIMIPLVGYMALFSRAPTWTVFIAVPLVLVGVAFVWSKPSRPGAPPRGR
jgi:uncharacterized membrane protein YbaN (DUF454 family)